jgi:flagellar basal-body rod protein FlgB
MSVGDIPLLQMIKGRLGYVNARQRLISENVANADTPNYAPRDLKPFTFAAVLKPQLAVAPVRTNAAHMSGTLAGPDSFKVKAAPDSETRLDGNQVVLEEQMEKMSAARTDYEVAIDAYQASMTMIQTAAKAPGK